jgi:DNA-directed RNA polymerase subunit RPC12/RpoP
MVDILLIGVPVIVVLFTVLFILLPRYGPHYTSRLKCPRCGKQFNYHWVPGATFTSLRYGNKRNLQCPYCHQKAIYNIAATRVSKTKTAKAKTSA